MAGPVNPKTGFSYAAPTQNTDSSAIGTVNRYEIGLSQTSQAGAPTPTYGLIKADSSIEPGALETTPISLIGTLAFGQWYASVRVVVKNSDGSESASAWSNEAAFVLAAPTPNAPTGFTVA